MAGLAAVMAKVWDGWLMSLACRIAGLDGLRALAVSMVFVTHINGFVLPGGILGGDSFFALSGFLITNLLVKEWQPQASVWLLGFYARRALRLYPALLVMVPAAVGIGLWEHIGAPRREGLAAVLYLTDLYAPLTHEHGGVVLHTWSLAVEEQFYLVWPMLLVLLLRRHLAIPGVTAVMVLSTGASAVAVQFLPAGDLFFSPLPHVSELGAGALLALALPGRGWLRRLLRSPWVPGGLLLASIVALPLMRDRAFLSGGGFTLIGLAAAWLVGHVVVCQHGWLTRRLEAGPLLWLGKRSYGFYLWHLPILNVFIVRHASYTVTAVGGLGLSLLATAMSWRYVERPILGLRSRFESQASTSVRT